MTALNVSDRERELEDAMLEPLVQSIDDLYEMVDRPERDGVYSGEAAEAAREEIEGLIAELHCVSLSNFYSMSGSGPPKELRSKSLSITSGDNDHGRRWCDHSRRPQWNQSPLGGGCCRRRRRRSW
jgi:hypothetical protein